MFFVSDDDIVVATRIVWCM